MMLVFAEREGWCHWPRQYRFRAWADKREGRSELEVIFQAVGFVRVESYPTQAVLPLVGLAANKIVRDRFRDRYRTEVYGE
ncbi:MAG: hypothetical protein ACODAD_12800 [Planctomycetota bacterium]